MGELWLCVSEKSSPEMCEVIALGGIEELRAEVMLGGQFTKSFR